MLLDWRALSEYDGFLDIGNPRGKIGRSPVITIFMLVVQHGFDLSKTTPETIETFRFLNHCQQQATAANHPKIASITFPIASIAPWVVLSVLGKADCRHFYYDSPQQWALVGIGVAVGCGGTGHQRFAQAQTFMQTWRRQFIYAEPRAKAAPVGRFFCSATFF
ncbi:MAG: hypothetical protein HC800_17180 [Phormidesmis sp. RL_2_1]|nr:hypothetical protein [Phormidesmis sp. RL_2_1]